MPYFEALKFISLASTSGLSVLRQTILRSRLDKAPERRLLELGLAGERMPDSELVLHSDGEKWSEPYVQLTKDFYVKIKEDQQ